MRRAARDAVDDPGGLRHRLAALTGAEQEEVLLRLVCAHLATALGRAGAGHVPADREIRDLGFDSLTALTARDALESATGPPCRRRWSSTSRRRRAWPVICAGNCSPAEAGRWAGRLGVEWASCRPASFSLPPTGAGPRDGQEEEDMRVENVHIESLGVVLPEWASAEQAVAEGRLDAEIQAANGLTGAHVAGDVPAMDLAVSAARIALDRSKIDPEDLGAHIHSAVHYQAPRAPTRPATSCASWASAGCPRSSSSRAATACSARWRWRSAS